MCADLTRKILCLKIGRGERRFSENHTQEHFGQPTIREFEITISNKGKVIKPHDRLVLVSSALTGFTLLAYQTGGLPVVFRELALRETLSWEELGT
jgi:hypothetical protein